MKIPEALPCPYCGNDPQHVRLKIKWHQDIESERDHQIKCVNKKCRMRPKIEHHLLKYALLSWNQRP